LSLTVTTFVIFGESASSTRLILRWPLQGFGIA
jgi:hypothetical protein